MTCPERPSRLLRLLAIAYWWAFAAGRWLAQNKPLPRPVRGAVPGGEHDRVGARPHRDQALVLHL